MLRKLYLSAALIMLCTASSQTYGFLIKKKSTLDRAEEYAKKNPKKTAAYIGAALLAAYSCYYGGTHGFQALGKHLFEIFFMQGLVSAGVGFFRPYDSLLRFWNAQPISQGGLTANNYVAVPFAGLGATAHMIGSFIILKKVIEWHKR